MFESVSKLCIITDLDGTFLPKSKVPLPQDLKAVRRFEAAGGLFTIATGRTVEASKRYPEELGLKSPMIVFNGAGIYDAACDRLLYTHPLPEAAREMTRRILQDNPHAGAEVLCAASTWVVNDTPIERQHIKVCGVTPRFGSVDEVREDWLKVLFAMEPEEIPDFIRYIDAQGFSGVDFIRSERRFYEMLPRGVSKGSALTAYRSLPGMEGFTFIAVGDFDNDVEMLRAADLAVVPQNAAASAKACADLILSRTCEEGAMEELIDTLLCAPDLSMLGALHRQGKQ
ncbi:MAG: HAD-IIB family hydrolase [Oscillospiraceae bacterium]|nr:HAD-IIB family hydrolase [Oscillospiraceae bacterium]